MYVCIIIVVHHEAHHERCTSWLCLVNSNNRSLALCLSNAQPSQIVGCCFRFAAYASHCAFVLVCDFLHTATGTVRCSNMMSSQLR